MVSGQWSPISNCLYWVNERVPEWLFLLRFVHGNGNNKHMSAIGLLFSLRYLDDPNMLLFGKRVLSALSPLTLHPVPLECTFTFYFLPGVRGGQRTVFSRNRPKQKQKEKEKEREREMGREAEERSKKLGKWPYGLVWHNQNSSWSGALQCGQSV